MAKATAKKIETTGTDLVLADKLDPAVLFGEDHKPLDELLKAAEKNVLSIVPDVSTAKGRKEIKANVSRVVKSKTTLEKAGKDHVAAQKELLKTFDKQRKYAFTFLEDLQKEARKTLTEWEDKEKARVEKYESIITSLIFAGESSKHWMDSTVEQLNELAAKVEEVVITKRFQEFEEEAEIARKEAVSKISGAISDRVRYDEEQVELKKLREAQVEQDRKNFEADQKRIAEEEARKKVIAANNEKKAAEERADAAEKQAAIDAEAAEEKRKLDVEAAAQAERDKVKAERLKKEREAAAREADKNHKGKINRAIVKELLKCGIDEVQAKKVVTVIAKKKILNIKISY